LCEKNIIYSYFLLKFSAIPRRWEGTEEGSNQAAKNSSNSAQAKNIFISSDGIQTWNERQFMSLSSDPSRCGDSVSKEMTMKQSYKTVT